MTIATSVGIDMRKHGVCVCVSIDLLSAISIPLLCATRLPFFIYKVWNPVDAKYRTFMKSPEDTLMRTTAKSPCILSHRIAAESRSHIRPGKIQE